MSVFSSKKTQQGAHAAKEKTHTESKQEAWMGMEISDNTTFISCDICFFCGGTSWIWLRLSVAEYEYQKHSKRIAGHTGRSKYVCTE